MQIVYISRRPDVLAETIKQVRRFMPFIDATVVACPEAVAHEVAAIQVDTLTVVTDEELLGDSNEGLTDHQERDLSLRSRLVARPMVQEMFVMSDDDARPLREIPKETFIEDGRYHNYYFYELSRWPSNRTDFDRGQHNTCAILDLNGYPHLSYASHMPQIIDRTIFLETIKSFSTAMKDYPLCEWSLYFNYAQREFPERFHLPRPYRTFCWPDAPFTWPLYVQPDSYYFENFNPHFYDSRGIFAGLPSTPAEDEVGEINGAKEDRWQQLARARLAGRPLLHDPWVRGSRLRWLAARIAAPWVRRRFSANLHGAPTT